MNNYNLKFNKNGTFVEGVRYRPILLCFQCGIHERRVGRKFCSMKCMGIARRGKQTWMKGKHHTDVSKLKLSRSHEGVKTWNRGIECPQFSGNKHWNWKGGVTKLSTAIRMSLQYKQWVKKIFIRDNWTCRNCNEMGSGNLEAHHLKSFSKIIEEYHIINFQMAKECKQLWDISNGVTLCINCHTKTESFPKNLRCAIVRTRQNKNVERQAEMTCPSNKNEN